MSSLVSEFIITPVLRQARRFSSGFATEESPASQHQRTRSAGEDSIFEDVEDVIAVDESDGSGSGAAVRTPERTPALPTLPPPTVHPAAVLLPALLPSQDRPRTAPEISAASDGQTIGMQQEAATTMRNQPLPEDDGYGDLRRRIRVVQEMEIPQNLKAQLMHQLLMEKYTHTRVPTSPPRDSPSNASPRTQASSSDRYVLPDAFGPLQALKLWNPLGNDDTELALPLTEEDLRPTYVPPRVPKHDGIMESPVEEVDPSHQYLGCKHYRRNVKLQCATCEKWYTCRICHDAVEDHTLPRQQTKHMLCMLCGCAQKASDTCVRCGETAANYYCGICKLWNDDPNKPIYHCVDCGLCRVGQGLGKDFFHCKKCMACISMSGGHKCIERSIDCDCPICGDYLFNSIKSVVFMQCGHSIHKQCFTEHMKTSYKCPICNKSCVNMETQFRNFDLAILSQPMPPEYVDTRAIISCNDCSARSQTSYHWLGLKCTLCNSYNTVERELLNMPGSSAEQQNSQQQAAAAETAPHPMLDSEAIARILLEQEQIQQARRRAERQNLTEIERTARQANAARRGDFSLARFLPARLRSPETPAREETTTRRHVVRRASRGARTVHHRRVPSSGMVDSALPSSSSTAATAGLTGLGIDLTPPESDSEREEDEDSILDLFWGRDRDTERENRRNSGNAITSAESAMGADEGEDLEEESSSEEEDCEDSSEEEDDPNEINLLGHR
ncbi:hypothetical protein QBC35DRAFT_118791 [Podospora australis]|uniref:Uncharacterized protein n=1 Tax=Podospora australis TaxID=1536484 RepID=A0AAN6X207_9PEZI|nr:hypothetical protein QBC35DRAFT_118791 [Podospora australis]